MTKEEIKKFLDDTKVYVDGKSAEIQKKLFSFGYYWGAGSPTEVRNLCSPFLYIHRNKEIFHSDDMVFFCEDQKRKVTAEEILSLEITEPSYRAFMSRDECWREIHRHPDFGWVKSKENSFFHHIDVVGDKVFIEKTFRPFCDVYERFEFTDGTPFGVKVKD